MKTKILGAVAAAILILVIAISVDQCNKPKPVFDPYKEQVLQLQDSIAKLNDSITAGQVRQADLEVKYNQESARADSLAKQTQKTIIRYREAREKKDTAGIIQAADSMSIECELLAEQVPVMKAQADSLIREGKDLQAKLQKQSEAYKALADVHENKVKELTDELERWKKLAKRRGRAIEW